MKLRTVVIATLLSYAQFFREGDNEYPKITLSHDGKATVAELVAYASAVTAEHNKGLVGRPLELSSSELGTGIIIHNAKPLEPRKLGAWLVFERLILLRYQGLPNQGRSTPPARTMAQTPKPPMGWVAMTMPAFLQALP